MLHTNTNTHARTHTHTHEAPPQTGSDQAQGHGRRPPQHHQAPRGTCLLAETAWTACTQVNGRKSVDQRTSPPSDPVHPNARKHKAEGEEKGFRLKQVQGFRLKQVQGFTWEF